MGIIAFVFVSNIINYKITDSYAKGYAGFKYPAQILNGFNSNNSYLINVREGGQYLLKYTRNINAVDFSVYNLTHVDKTKKTELKVFDKSFVSTTNKDNSGEKLIPFLTSKFPTDNFVNFIILTYSDTLN